MTTIASAYLLTGCAHQQSPTGGPDDKTGPSPVSMFPENESVNIKNDASIEVTFSEWILPTSVKGVKVYPSTPLKVKVKGNRLIVKPQNRLNDSTTYHCVITSTLKDLRNNPISRPISIVFSTGPVLDNGTIGGCVSDPSRADLQPNVALFREPRGADDSGYCGTADYLVQTDSNGVFAFNHIRSGSYRLLAYLDKNSDWHLQQGTDDLYLPVDSLITVSENEPRAVNLFPATFDTSRQTVASLTTINNRTIAGTWKRPYDAVLFSTGPTFLLEPFSGSDPGIKATFRQVGSSNRFYLLPDSALDTIDYRLMITARSVFDSATITDTLRVSGAATVDTIQPTLLRTLPDRQCRLFPTLKLIWSEPVRATDTLHLVDTLTLDTTIFTGDTSTGDTTSYTPAQPLLAGHVYRTFLTASDGYDFMHNPLKTRDSTDTAGILSLSVLHPDSFALSLSGSAPCLDTSALRLWKFTPFGGREPSFSEDNNDAFRFDSIPSGKGLLSSFIDYNHNGVFDPGRLIPFTAPEPYVSFPDTIEARARWDVEGISLGPCDPCEQKRFLAEKRAAEAKEDSLSNSK